MITLLRHRIEQGFATFATLLCRHPWWALLLPLLLAASLIAQLPKMRMDTSTESFLHQQDPTLQHYNQFRDQFGRDELVVVAITAPDLFTAPFIEQLTALHRELASEVPHLDDITSLINARNTYGTAGELVVQDLLAQLPDDAAGWEALRQRVAANPLYRNLLISEDGRTTTIVIKTSAFSGDATPAFDEVLAQFDNAPFDEVTPADGETQSRTYLTDEENSAVVKAVHAITSRYDSSEFQIHVAGSPAVMDALKRAMMTNMGRFTLLGVLTIALVLGVMFRRISGVLLPLGVVILSLLSTLGSMALLGVPFTLPIQILPSFLLAVGVGASVHILAIFYHHYHHSADHSDRSASIIHTFRHSGLAVVMTSLTTAAGLASFAGADVAPVADLGRFAAVGVVIALFYSMVLLPALLRLLPIPATSRGEAASHQRLDRLLGAIADLSVRRAGTILVVSALLAVVALAGVMQVRFSHTPHLWLSEQTPARQASDFIDRELQGAVALEVVIDTGVENGLYQPAVMAALQQLEQEVALMEAGGMAVGKTLSAATILREIHQALNENRPEFYRVPTDRQLIAQELLLFENSGSDDLEDFVDSQFQKARFTIKTPWVDAVAFPAFIDQVSHRFREHLGDQVTVTATGMNALLARTMSATIHSMAESYLIAALVITGMMILLLGSLRLGLVSMLPNFLPILLTLGLMGWLGLPLDLFTMLIGSIAIGLAVDDTIHFLHNYRRYHQQGDSVATAVRRTLLTSGRAMIVTTTVLSLGFFIYIFSTLSNLINFGLLTAFAILCALAADFLFAPALMAKLHHTALLPDDDAAV